MNKEQLEGYKREREHARETYINHLLWQRDVLNGRLNEVDDVTSERYSEWSVDVIDCETERIDNLLKAVRGWA